MSFNTVSCDTSLNEDFLTVLNFTSRQFPGYAQKRSHNREISIFGPFCWHLFSGSVWSWCNLSIHFGLTPATIRSYWYTAIRYRGFNQNHPRNEQRVCVFKSKSDPEWQFAAVIAEFATPPICLNRWKTNTSNDITRTLESVLRRP